MKFIEPHRKVSRKVGLSDYERVVREAKEMGLLMYADPNRNCVGIAHPQVDGDDPLAFFITRKSSSSILRFYCAPPDRTSAMKDA